jgi:hypothetical protein
MPEQSHREEMSAAIRAQRERHAVPRSMAPAPDPTPAPLEPPPKPQQEPRKGLLARLLHK